MLGRVWTRWLSLVALVLIGLLVYNSNLLVPHVEFSEKSVEIYDETRHSHNRTSLTDQMFDGREKQRAIEEAIRESWQAFSDSAFGSDAYMPISKQGKAGTGIGLFMLDALDTLLMVGLKDEAQKIRDHLTETDFKKLDVEVNVYEAMSRGVGGLLSAYHVSHDVFYAQKAVQLAERLLPALETESGIPAVQVNLKTAKLGGPDVVPLSEIGSIQLELRYLGNLTNSRKYLDAADLLIRTLDAAQPEILQGGLLPDRINRKSGKPVGSNIMYNVGQGSFYGNVIRQNFVTRYTNKALFNMAEEIMDSINKQMVETSQPSRYKFLSSMPKGVASNQRQFVMDQDACSLAGLLGVHSTRGYWFKRAKLLTMTEKDEERFRLGTSLIRSCAATWLQSPTGIAPYRFAYSTSPNSKVDFRTQDSRSLQASGLFESLFYYFHLNRDPLYRDWGWEIFTALQKVSRLEDGSFAALKDVGKGKQLDYMNPSWIGGSLKFLWLLFDHVDAPGEFNQMSSSRGHFFPVFETDTESQWTRKKLYYTSKRKSS